MAVNEIGVRVKLEGEREYNEQMKQITQQTKLMRSETKSLEEKWRDSGSSMKKASEQSELLTKQIDRQKDIVKTAEENVRIYTEKTGENSTQTLKWKNALQEAKNELQRLETELAKVPNKMQILGQNMQTVGGKLQSVGKKMSAVGSTLTRTITVPIAALATASIKTTADFDTSMSKVQALSGATGNEFTALRNKAREMGATTKYSAGESADALSYMALAGWDTNQMLDGLDGVMNLAAASGMDLASASDLVTDYLSAFGLEAKDSSRMADELAYAQAHSNTTTEQLGEAFGNSAAQMHTAGQSMETTTAILEAFANQGLKGSEAGTALSAMMRDITQKMKDGKIQIGDTTIEVQDANGNFRDMTDILADVEAATDGMGSAEKSAALMTTFTARSVKGVSMALTEGTDNIKNYRDQLYASGGAAKSMAEIMQDNLAGQLTKLKSALQELGISFGDILVPKIRTAVEWVQKQVDKFNSLDESTKENIVRFGLLAAALGPVLLIGGKLISSVGSILQVGGQFIEWIGSVTAGHAGLAAAINPVTIGLGAIGAAAVIAYTGYKDLENNVRNANTELYDSIDAVNETTNTLETTGDNLKQGFADAAEAIEQVETNGRRASRVADEIEKLTKKTSLTADEQARLKVLVAEMNEIFPEMGLAIDDVTGALNMSNTEIRAFIDNEYKMAKAAAYNDAITKALTGLAEAEMAVAKAQIEREQLNENYRDAQTAYDYAINKYTESLEHYDDVTQELIKSGTQQQSVTENQKVALNDSSEALAENQEAIDENIKAQEEAEEQVKLWEAALQLLADQSGMTVEELLGMNEATEKTGESMEGMADDTEDAADTIDDATQKIRDDYMSTYESAKESLMGQSDLWDEMEEETTTSVAQMQANLAQHRDALRKWNTNANKLMSSTEYKTDQTFRNMVNYIIAGGEEMAPELDALVQEMENADGDISGLVATFGDMDTLSGYYAQALATANTELEHGTQATVNALTYSGVPKAAKKMMSDTSDAISNYDLGNAATKAVKTVEKAKPEAGKQGEGLVKEVVKGVDKQKYTLDEKMFSIGSSSAKKVGNGITSAIGSVTSDAQTFANSVADRFASRVGDTYGWGKQMVENFASGIKKAQETAFAVAQKVANAVASMFRHSVPKTGPFAHDDLWGYHMAQNFASGMIRGIPVVEAAANDLAMSAVLPTKTMLDIDAGKVQTLTTDDIYNAFSMAFAEQETKIVIGNREFGRILRDQGVA